MKRYPSFATALLSALLLLSLPSALRATVMVYLPVEDLTQMSDVIVRGRVHDVRSDWTGDRESIVTYVALEAEEWWKGGGSAGDMLLVRVPGGEVDGIGLTYAGMPRFEAGDEVVVFLRPIEEGFVTVVGLRQGLLRVTGEDTAVRDFSGIEVVSREAGGKAAPEEMGFESYSLAELRKKVETEAREP